MLGIGAIIGTGIFVLTAGRGQKAGPGMMYRFVIAGVVCALTALIYAELASMVPVSGSAYTYSYARAGRNPGLDGRLGADPRIRGRRGRGRGGLVRLYANGFLASSVTGCRMH